MLKPLNPSRWTPAHAAHLLGRAGFGGTPEEIRALHARGFDGAVEAMLAGDEDSDLFPPPDWAADARPVERIVRESLSRGSSEEERKKAFQQAQRESFRRMEALRADWLARMLHTPHPLREKMTLFWHGHFATSVQKVREPLLMWTQNETLRARALGNFGDLVKEISRDPAMIRWLDLGRSDRKNPNENFGRELLELFTLGEGHYTEDDIKEAARAFTGYRIRPDDQTFLFAAGAHDRDLKRFMGRAGRFNGDDIIEIILANKQCARFVGSRIWEFFVYESPAPPVLDAVAAAFRGGKYEVEPLLRTIFRSEEFYSDRAMRRQIKSPVQWLVQACRTLETELPPQPALDGALNQLGQVPFVPPNVRGWEGGRSWISSATLVLRYNLAGYLAGAPEEGAAALFRAKARDLPLARIAPPALRGNPDALAGALVGRLFGTEELPAMRERALAAIQEAGPTISDADISTVIHRLMSTPDYQLT
jgi:uncharacterized protein (DUF1800 family)